MAQARCPSSVDVRRKIWKICYRCAFLGRISCKEFSGLLHKNTVDYLLSHFEITRGDCILIYFAFDSESQFFGILDTMKSSPGTGEGESAGRGPSPRAQAGTLFLLPRLEGVAQQTRSRHRRCSSFIDLAHSRGSVRFRGRNSTGDYHDYRS